MRNYVVTGTGRSGTAFTARLFTGLGWRCGHEEVFTPRLERFTGFGPYLGDASWFAVPHLPTLSEEVLVIHQVREPLATIRSLASLAVFRHWWEPRTLDVVARNILRRRPPPRGPFHRFARRHSPRSWEHWSPFARAARHWVDWNTTIETLAAHRRYVRVKVEDYDRELLDHLADSIGVQAREPLWPSPATNSRRRAFDRASFDDLPPNLAGEVNELAVRYGY